MKTFPRGGVCHVVPYKIHGDMTVNIEVNGHVKNYKSQELLEVWSSHSQ